MNVGERKVHEIIERFGYASFRAGIGQILDYAEEQARAIVRRIPNGSYFFADYADEDTEGRVPCRIALTLRVADDTVELDYTGTDPQVASSLNMPTGGRERHPIVLVGLTYVLFTMDPTLLLNAGTLRVARAILPPGSLVNAEAPAAVGMRSLTCMLTQIVTFGAFARALLGNTDIVHCQPRDIIRVVGPGAGGYGDPSTRDPALVADDVRCGFVSADAAERDYGVVVRDGQADVHATAESRARCRTQRVEAFDVGPRRREFELIWTEARYDILTAFLAKQPVSWRHYLKHAIFSAVAEGRHSERGMTAQMQSLVAELGSTVGRTR